MIALVDKLEKERCLSHEEFVRLIRAQSPALMEELAKRAVEQRRRYYGDRVFLRGLIEFTNFCKNDCYYCGLRKSNRAVHRYRLTQEQIMDCCRKGYALGFRSFVLQGGEDPWYNPERIRALVCAIKEMYPDCAVSLSVGEQPKEVYKSWYDAGADRYLLRHETADGCHYQSLHPEGMTLEGRLECLRALKEIGYQVGCGFMVGSPGQTPEHIARDLELIHELQPHMVGIGPFIPQKDTPFGGKQAGTVEQTLFLLSIVRLMLPQVLLPATTALGTIHPEGRERGILSGANVCMPNLSPAEVRGDYALYDNKLYTGDEAAESVRNLKCRMENIGCQIDMSRGDHVSIERML